MKKKPIEFIGDNNLLIWKLPSKVASFNKEIIVPFSHEVVFVKNGIIMQTLEAGKHILNPKDFGFLAKILGKKTIDDDCKVYYVNKTVNQKILWGTTSLMSLFDKTLEIPVSLGANGILEIKVNNARKFMGKIAGSSDIVTLEKIEGFFNEQISLYLKVTVAEIMEKGDIGFYNLDAHLIELSSALKAKLMPIFDDYGVSVENAVINGIMMPQDTKDKIQSMYFRKKQQKEGLTPENVTIVDNVPNLPSSLFVCANCGANLTADAKVCPVCNFEVEENKDRFCFYCGKKLLKTSNICSRCKKENN